MEKRIKLRPLEETDLHFLYEVENEEDLWHLSDRQQGFSKKILLEYIQNADRSIYEAGQLRLGIELISTHELLGFVDLYDFDPRNRKAGVGIIIYNKLDRNKGYGKEVLERIISYAFKKLFLHQLFAEIAIDNFPSIRLFEKAGFIQTGIKKDWIFNGDAFTDVFFYQLINES